MKTYPIESGERSPAHRDISHHAVKNGVATRYWLELLSWPDEIQSLWLYIDGNWKHLDSPSMEIQRAMQQAFQDYPGGNQEVVAYFHHRRIVGLYVRSKEIQTQ